MTSLRHLTVRALSSIANSGVSAEEDLLVRSVLLDREYELWNGMDGRDQRHSIKVMKRFDVSCAAATRAERAAALLHDVGKVASGLGWVMRVLATVVGPRTERFRRYHHHESIGAEMLSGVSHPRTIELVMGTGCDSVARALKDADDL